MFKERHNDSWEFLESAEGGSGEPFELIRSCDGAVGDAVPLGVIPNLFHWIEFWRVPRQEKQAEPSLASLDIVPDRGRAVDRVAVNDQENRANAIALKAFEKLNKLGGDHRFLVRHEPDRPPARDRGDHIQRKPRAGSFDHWCLTYLRPSGSSVIIGADKRLVQKINLSSHAFRLAANFRVSFFLPVIYGFWFLLVSAAKRLLRRKPKLGQQSGHAPTAELDLEFHTYRLGDQRTSPQGEREFHLPGIPTGDQLVNPLDRDSVQFRLTPPALAGVQRVPTSTAIERQPIIDRLARHAQYPGHGGWGFARLDSGYPTLSQGRQLRMCQFPNINSHNKDNIQARSGIVKLLCTS